MMDIAIIGGGITGLTTALALAKQGIASTVYERAPKLNEVGAGIWLQPNALKVLNYLGLKETILKNSIELDRVDITDSQLHSFKIGENTVQDHEGNKIVSIHRAKLQQILYEALPPNSVKLDYDFQLLNQLSNKVEINFDAGKVEADYVFGTDGINSKIRKQLFPQSSLRHSGQTCWRGISDIQLPAELKNLGREAWGNRVRFGFSQISDDAVYWFAVAKAKPFEKDDVSKLKNDLNEKFKDFHQVVNQIINHTAVEKIIRGDILDLRRLGKWHHQNVCLLGDAAHATTPNMGQGAGQGIEDAYVLAKLFASDQFIGDTFSKFEDLRRTKVDYVVNNSWRFGKIAHSSFGTFLMKSIMKLTPESVINRQLEKLYSLPI
ncbi:FAD-dependent oxidoreductase [Marivirga sp.]|uniref:FAD-dependent oxidoreductase n=1 Tax=Marivirga sp. TaxID=2018662 RepID=UPI003DA78A8A